MSRVIAEARSLKHEDKGLMAARLPRHELGQIEWEAHGVVKEEGRLVYTMKVNTQKNDNSKKKRLGKKAASPSKPVKPTSRGIKYEVRYKV